MTHYFTSAAQTDFREAAFYYEHQSAGLGDQFLDELVATVERICMFPEAWGKVDERYRHCHMRRFPFTLIYLIREEEIVIVSVFHQRRKPSSWKDEP
ncbi:MAG: type II toxin-antitoxin system RelE/ParE family toxin [Verrucomicrobiales bacterium]